MKTTEKIILGIVALSWLIAWYLYPILPDEIPIHWNAAGEVDGYGSKLVGLLLMPMISIGIALLFIAIPRIAPMKKNIEKFRRAYDTLAVAVMAFFFYIYVLIIIWTLDLVQGLNFMQLFMPAIAALYWILGGMMGKTKRNYFIGIRTPWTLSSDAVWEKTHRIGGRLFKLAAVISLVGVLAGEHAIWFILVPVIAFVVYLYYYSYREFQKEKRKR